MELSGKTILIAAAIGIFVYIVAGGTNLQPLLGVALGLVWALVIIKPLYDRAQR